MQPGSPSLYVKSSAAYGVTYRSSEAECFESEMEATTRLLELRLPRDWFVVEVKKENHNAIRP